ncbi:helix-turn-helix domain-containing protein [Kribbella sp. VKM Ac-2568]|uniref:helix-turn-helix domain-containing protein n=1 Tax=Kribbella sp. VKM Ac-2568 TaxID=2512219 RepID=UPI0010535073|nr:helix-turn-helix domain-containing protein [Kribbella sp. VKM Ac-2568]TCM41247.1 Homeodomain-like domain-containing protein [Kribbella sp. VKM Ac-2568]
MTVIDQWTGRHARALQAAMRLTNEAFAEHLGVSPRTIAKWRERPGMVPSPQLQEALDTSLTLATEDTRTRFASNLNLPPPDDDPITLDTSVVSQLHAVVGELARVLAALQPPKAPTQADTATRLDEVQT